MSQIIGKIWNDAAWSKVIAGVILTIGVSVVTYFLNWWSTIGILVTQCYSFASASTFVPNWILFLLGLLTLPTVIILCALVWQKVFPPQSTALSWRDYTTDLFFGLRWRWSYLSDGQIYNLHTFCPHCDFQVYAQNVSSYRAVDHIAFHCESCGHQLGKFQESFASLENKTIRFVQQKLRNGMCMCRG